MLELDGGRDNRVIDDRVADNLPGSRATKDGGPFEVVAQLIHEFARLDQRSGAKNENDPLPFNFSAGQIRLPSFALGPFILFRFH